MHIWKKTLGIIETWSQEGPQRFSGPTSPFWVQIASSADLPGASSAFGHTCREGEQPFSQGSPFHPRMVGAGRRARKVLSSYEGKSASL